MATIQSEHSIVLLTPPECDKHGVMECVHASGATMIHTDTSEISATSGNDIATDCAAIILQGFGNTAIDSFLQTRREQHPIPIIVVLGAATSDSETTHMQLGAWDCVREGDWSRLSSAIRTALRFSSALRDARLHLDCVCDSSTTFEILPNPVLLIDLDGRVLYENSVAEDLRKHMCAGDDERVTAEWTSLFASVFDPPKHRRIDAYSGKKLYQLDILPSPKQQAVYVFGYDISDRLQAERMLRQSETLFRRAFHTSPDAVNINRLSDGLYVDVNAGFTALTGYERDEVIGKTSNEISIWYDPEDRLQLVIKLQKLGSVKNLEARFRMKSGIVRTGLMSASVIFIDDIPHILSITRDITEIKLAEQALRESEKRYRSIFENTGTATVLYGEDSIIRMCNSNFAELTGYEKKDIIGKLSWMAFVHPEDLPRMMEYHKARTRKRYLPTSYEFRLVSSSGETRDMLLHICLIPGSDERIISMHNVTDLKRTEHSLRSSEERYRSLQNNLPIGVFRTTPDGRFIQANPATLTILGIPSMDDLDRISVADFYVNPMDRDALLHQLREKGTVENYECLIKRLDGVNIWCSMNVRATFDDNGNLLHQDGIMTDISDRRTAEMQRRKLHDAIQQSPSSVVIMDADGRIEYVNPKFSELTGYSALEVIGTTWPLLQHKPETDSMHHTLWNNIRSGLEWRGEVQQQRRSGDWYWEACTVKGIHDEADVITHIIAVTDDVSERKRMQQDVIVAKEKAEEMNRLKSTFLATMSHELRTPLNGILGFATLLAEDLMETSHREMAATILNSGNRLLDTLNGILDLSVVEADKLNVVWSDVNLNTLIEEVRRLYQANAERKSLYLTAEIDLPSLIVRTDERLVRQILNNLANNALKYTRSGGVTIRLDRFEALDHEYAVIHIEDTGIGISEADQSIIFEAFRQASEGYSRAYEGTGLGLSVSRKFAQILGGDIKLRSEQGKGSCFSLHLPLGYSEEMKQIGVVQKEY